MRQLRPFPGAAHTGYLVAPPPNRAPTPVDELREAPRPGMPGHAGSAPTRMLDVAARTPVVDRRGKRVGWVQPGDVVPVAKGIGAAGQVVHVITDGPLAGRVIYRHQPTYQPGRPAAPAAVLGVGGPE